MFDKYLLKEQIHPSEKEAVKLNVSLSFSLVSISLSTDHDSPASDSSHKGFKKSVGKDTLLFLIGSAC